MGLSGVLLFDELPEFARVIIEGLRQPHETRIVTIPAAKDTAEYPAHFISVGAANPALVVSTVHASPAAAYPTR